MQQQKIQLCFSLDDAGGTECMFSHWLKSITAPTIIMPTSTTRPLASLFLVVLMMWLSSSVVIILLSNIEGVSHVCEFSVDRTL